MTSQPVVTIVHNNVDAASSIGKLASWAVRVALEQDWHVNVVARDVDQTFVGEVKWLPLYVPPRAHLLQWASAEATVRWALRGVSSDLIHVYQPQLTGFADTWHVEFLSRVAVDTGSLGSLPGARARMRRAQARAVAVLEDRCIRRYRDHAWVLWCSAYLRDEYIKLYGAPRRGSVLDNPALDVHISGSTAARPRRGQPVLGYLGGTDPRKGWVELLDAVVDIPGLRLVMAGPGSDGFRDERLGDRVISLGHRTDLSEFWDAVDILVAPSRFEPFGLVVVEAAARGKPVIVTPAVGAAHLVEQHGAGFVWTGGAQQLHQLISECQVHRESLVSGARSLVESVSRDAQSAKLLATWERILEAKA